MGTETRPHLSVLQGGKQSVTQQASRSAVIRLDNFSSLPSLADIDREMRHRQRERGRVKEIPASALEDLPALSRIASRLEPALRRVFIHAVRRTKDTIGLEALAQAILTGTAANRLNALAQLESFERRFAAYEGPLRRGFIQGSNYANRVLQGAGLSISFNLMDAHAASFAQNHTPKLVASIVEGGREVIRQIIEDAVTFGDTPDTAARRIRSSIGMTMRDYRAYEKIREELEDQGFEDDVLARKLARVERSLINRRAKTIARTEIIRAANAGQMGVWHEAVTQGLISKRTVKKQWIATDDELLEAICRGLDEMVVGLDEEFMPGVSHPPQHPNCRCAMRLRFTEEVTE